MMTLKVDRQGRITLPLEWRRTQALETGSEVVVTLISDRLCVQTRAQSLSQAQMLVAQYSQPGGSVVDEFLAERRRDAQSEEGDASQNAEGL